MGAENHKALNCPRGAALAKDSVRVGLIGAGLNARMASTAREAQWRASPVRLMKVPRHALTEMLLQEGEDLAPAVHRLLRPVRCPVVIEEAVARAVVPVELVGLVVSLQLLLV